jgi:hypothetical protein
MQVAAQLVAFQRNVEKARQNDLLSYIRTKRDIPRIIDDDLGECP